MEFWFGVGVMVVGIVVSIALHEIGHLIPAKAFGVKVTDYFVGFGKTLWSTRRGETEYGVKMLPLGGFVRMVGMFPPARADVAATTERTGIRGWADRAAQDARSFSAEEVAPGQEHRAFYSLSAPKKLAVMFGGPVMNLLICAVLFAIILTTFGQLTPTNRLATVSECVLPPEENRDRKSTRLNSSHVAISYAVFCLKKKMNQGGKILSSFLRGKLSKLKSNSLNREYL